jgi:hypothetical protein
MEGTTVVCKVSIDLWQGAATKCADEIAAVLAQLSDGALTGLRVEVVGP